MIDIELLYKVCHNRRWIL